MKYTTINEFKQSLINEASRYSKNFTKIKFNSHKNHNPNADIVEGWINDNSFITYVLDLKSGVESMEYYTGENYTARPGKSFSRHFQITQIPKKYRALWEELKTIYQTQYKNKSTNESNEMRGYRSFEYDIKNKTLEQTDAGVASELSIQDYYYDYDNDKAILDLPEDKESIKRIFNSGIIHLPYMSTHYGHNEIKELCEEWVLKNWFVGKGVDISESTDISLGKIVTLQDGHTYEITKIENNIYTLVPELGKSITLSKEELIRKLEFINEQNYRLSTDFNFEDFDDTDLSGPSAEMAIDTLIEEYINIVKSTITKEEYGENFYFLRNNAIREIFRLWKDKMHNTIKENKSRLMTESDEIEINEKLSEIDKAKREWEKIKPRVESMFLKLKEQAAKCSDFGTITVRMPQFRPNDNEVFIYQYLDRIFRRPDEYGARGRKAENSPKYHKFEDLLSKLDQFITDKMSKYGVSVDVSA